MTAEVRAVEAMGAQPSDNRLGPGTSKLGGSDVTTSVSRAVVASQPAERFVWERALRARPKDDISWRGKLVGLTIATYANADGTRMHPGQELLAEVTSTSPSTVQRALGELVGKGYLRLVAGGKKVSGRSRGAADEYRLTLPIGVPADRQSEGLPVSGTPDCLSVSTPTGGLTDHPPAQDQNKDKRKNERLRSRADLCRQVADQHDLDDATIESALRDLEGEERIAHPLALLPKLSHAEISKRAAAVEARDERAARKCPHGMVGGLDAYAKDGTVRCQDCQVEVDAAGEVCTPAQRPEKVMSS